MKYCLSVGIHNLFFDLAIVNQNHQIIKKYKFDYDRNKDIASNIYSKYQKYCSSYRICSIGVGVSNNVEYKDDFLYKITSFNFNRYNLKQALFKLFKVSVYILEDTHLASLAIAYMHQYKSLLYVILDKKISNSLVIEHQLLELDEDLNFKNNERLNLCCCKDSLKRSFLAKGFDDDNICLHFLSNKEEAKNIIQKWVLELSKEIRKIINEVHVDNIVFGGFVGEYYDEFKDYISINKNIAISSTNKHRELTLIGVSHLIFKDN